MPSAQRSLSAGLLRCVPHSAYHFFNVSAGRAKPLRRSMNWMQASPFGQAAAAAAKSSSALAVLPMEAYRRPMWVSAK